MADDRSPPSAGTPSAPGASSSERADALRAMVEADPRDELARLLLGNELLSLGAREESVVHLSAYVATFEGDKGAAFLALGRAHAALGDRGAALEAIDRGIANARAHRHLQLVASLEAERADIEGAAS